MGAEKSSELARVSAVNAILKVSVTQYLAATYALIRFRPYLGHGTGKVKVSSLKQMYNSIFEIAANRTVNRRGGWTR